MSALGPYIGSLRLGIYTREWKYFLLKNWYGIRKGIKWNNHYLIDIGAITIRLR